MGTESKKARKLEIQTGNSQSNVTALPGIYFYSSLGSVASVIIKVGGIVMFYHLRLCSLNPFTPIDKQNPLALDRVKSLSAIWHSWEVKGTGTWLSMMFN